VKSHILALFRDEESKVSVEYSIIFAVLVGLLCVASAVSSSRTRYVACTTVALHGRSSWEAENWSSESAFAEQHWRINRLAVRWAASRETVRMLVKDDPAVIKISQGRKKAHTTYIIAPSVAQRIHARLSNSDSPFDQVHYRIGDPARRWALGREKVRLLVKDEPGVMRFRQGRKNAHTMYSVPESVAQRIYTRLLNAA
jgi:hypothetical protein